MKAGGSVNAVTKSGRSLPRALFEFVRENGDANSWGGFATQGDGRK